MLQIGALAIGRSCVNATERVVINYIRTDRLYYSELIQIAQNSNIKYSKRKITITTFIYSWSNEEFTLYFMKKGNLYASGVARQCTKYM